MDIRSVMWIRLAIIVTSWLGGQAAAADITAPPPASQPAAAIEEVIVTGSRIPVPTNISATSPTTIVTSQEFLPGLRLFWAAAVCFLHGKILTGADSRPPALKHRGYVLMPL